MTKISFANSSSIKKGYISSLIGSISQALDGTWYTFCISLPIIAGIINHWNITSTILASFFLYLVREIFNLSWSWINNGVNTWWKSMSSDLLTRSGLFFVICGIISGPIGGTGYALCLNEGNPLIGALFFTLPPLVSSFLNSVFLKDKISWVGWLGIYIGICSLLLFTLIPLLTNDTFDVKNIGLSILGGIIVMFSFGIDGSLADYTYRKSQKNLLWQSTINIKLTFSVLSAIIVFLPLLSLITQENAFLLIFNGIFHNSHNGYYFLIVMFFCSLTFYLIKACLYGGIKYIGAITAMNLIIVGNAFVPISMLIFASFSNDIKQQLLSLTWYQYLFCATAIIGMVMLIYFKDKKITPINKLISKTWNKIIK